MKRLWRIVRWLLAALVALVLLTIASALVLARTDWARERMRQTVVQRAKRDHGIDLELADLNLELFPPALRLSDVEVLGSDGQSLLHVPRSRSSSMPAP